MARTKRQQLTTDAIVEAAIRLIEEEGLPALSARRLASRLGCEAMSLYHHVQNMDGLADRIIEHLLMSIPTERGTTPRANIADGARAYLAMALANPNTFPLVATRRWRRPGAQARAIRFVELFTRCGADDPWGRARVLGAYLNGAGLALAACRKDPDLSREGCATIERQLDAGIDSLLADLG